MQMPVSLPRTGWIVRTGLYVSKAQISKAQDDWNAAAWASAQVRASAQPAALVNADGLVIDANPGFDPLLISGRLVSALQAAVIESCLSRRTHVARISTRADRGEDLARRFDVTLVPVEATKTLVVARDTTLEANLINALAASRQLFRDLALCSNDFAFETDAFAHFTYTSPGGLLGHTTQDLHGARPRSFFPNAEVNQLFSVKAPIQGREAWTTDRNGDDACIVVTSIPMHDSSGEWCGARGVVRDITRQKFQERDVADARAREDLVSAIVTAMRAQIEPRRMMLAAADAIAAATNADRTTIEAPQIRMQAAIGSVEGNSHVLVRQTAHHGRTNGTLTLARASSGDDFGPQELRLVDTIMPHLGLAIALAELIAAKDNTATPGETSC
jgi:PAS domain-containing protein